MPQKELIKVVSYNGIEKQLDKMLEIGDIDQDAFDILKTWIDNKSMRLCDAVAIGDDYDNV